jgi:enoyl-CoA hydratase/carnithine racemase
MDFGGVRMTADGSIAQVTLDRPEKRNVLSLDTLRALQAALTAVPDEAGAVILSAEGPVFSAGHDMGEMLDRPDEFYNELFSASADTMETIQRIPQPVIAEVQGPATAAGCQLVASCDLAVASEDAWFATPGVKIGLFCTTPMVPVSRAVGQKRAMQMLLTGEPISAQTAVEWGLINEVVPAERLDEAVDAMASKIVRYSTDTISIGKHAFYAQLGLTSSDAYEVAAPIMAGNAANVDAQEGMAAFLDKRDPQWTGRTG